MIDTSMMKRVIPSSGDPCDGPTIPGFAREARQFATFHQWCDRVTSTYVAMESPALVFLLDIVTRDEKADPQVWIVSGELPLTYLDIESCRTPQEAIATYAALVGEWIDLKLRSKPTSGLIQLNKHGNPKRYSSRADAKELLPLIQRLSSHILDDVDQFGELDPEVRAFVQETYDVNEVRMNKLKSEIRLAQREIDL